MFARPTNGQIGGLVRGADKRASYVMSSLGVSVSLGTPKSLSADATVRHPLPSGLLCDAGDERDLRGSPAPPRRGDGTAILAAEDLARPGEHQDAQVAIRHLRELVRERGTSLQPHALFVLGQMAERYRAQAEEQRSVLPAAYRRARGKAWRRLRRAMDDERAQKEVELSRWAPSPERVTGPVARAPDSSAVPA